MYAKLALALVAIGLSLYGRQAESQSSRIAQVTEPLVSASPIEVPPLKPMQGIMIDWKERVIHAQGIGYGSESADPAVRGMLAMRAARADALKKLAFVVYGLHVDPMTTVDALSAPHEKVRLKIEGLIRGAQEAGDPEQMSDGGVRIRLVLPLTGLEKNLALSVPIPKQ